MKNIDRVHNMTEDQLVQLWSVKRFDGDYIRDNCQECEWSDFDCDSCPETFRNWLGAELDPQTAEYIIHACPERMWYVENYLIPSMRVQGIEPTVRCDTEHLGNLESCMRIFQSMDSPGGTWHLQDDVIICSDFKKRTEALVSDDIVCGFVADVDENRKHIGYVKPEQMWWTFPCVYIPNNLAKECADWFYRIKNKPAYHIKVQSGKLDDWFFKRYMTYHYPDYSVLNLKPALVDHIDYLIGGTTINQGRKNQIVRAMWFEDQDLVEGLEKNLDQ